MIAPAHPSLGKRLIDGLYVEAMLLADEARGYFEEEGRAQRDALAGLERIGFSCESLRVTTRLMHVIAWLLTQRAVTAGELTLAQATAPERRLGHAQASDPAIVPMLPDTARQLVLTSIDLYARVLRLDERLDARPPAASPVRGLMARLESAF